MTSVSAAISRSQRLGLLEWMRVPTLQVLDDGGFAGGLVVEGNDVRLDRRDLGAAYNGARTGSVSQRRIMSLTSFKGCLLLLHYGDGAVLARLRRWIQSSMKLLQVFGPFKTLVLAAAIFIPFERLAAARRDQPILRRGWATDLLTGVLNGLVLSVASLAGLAVIDSTAAAVAPGMREWIASRPLWAQAVVAVVAGDFGTYVMHRLAHTIPWLWRIHAVHHSAEELDWLIAFRFHPIDLLLMRVATLTPLVALNISPVAVAFFVAVGVWQAWLVHANVRISYGPLERAFVSPHFHHWHHSADREAFDKNFAGIIAAWDFIFNTAHLPRARHPQRYGTTESVPAGYLERLLHPTGRTSHAEELLDAAELRRL